jgi:hypothetical protein
VTFGLSPAPAPAYFEASFSFPVTLNSRAPPRPVGIVAARTTERVKMAKSLRPNSHLDLSLGKHTPMMQRLGLPYKNQIVEFSQPTLKALAGPPGPVTGKRHRASWCIARCLTIHADTPQLAFEKFLMLGRQASISRETTSSITFDTRSMW